MTGSPGRWSDPVRLAGDIVRVAGGDVVLAIPLGLGKPNALVNALYRQVAADPALRLRIHTALSFEVPAARGDMQRRFLQPWAERIYAGYEELEYVRALRRGELPANIEVVEFFLSAGRWLGVDAVQQNVVCANYTDAVEYILASGINTVAQMIAAEEDSRYSLSCNPDITVPLLRARREGETAFRFVGQVDDGLPYMYGEAEIPALEFDDIIDGPAVQSRLFNVPKRPVGLADYAAGFYAAALIPDGGTLQVGIGSIGDAVAHALILRQRDNAAFRDILRRLGAGGELSPQLHLEPFSEGLYAASEMFLDVFLDLIEAGVLKREVDGCVAHAVFFVGSEAFYRRLRELSPRERRRIGMSSVLTVNASGPDMARKSLERPGARFINNAMKATLLGAVVSDGLENGQVISGVGGQFDFVHQAFALKGARSLLVLNSVRDSGTGVENNIVWSYGHQTVPRQFRDIIITEYGVADLRGRRDREVVERMVAVADARFQPELLRRAREAGKLPGDGQSRGDTDNTPSRLRRALQPARDKGLLPVFPFGTDFTDTEQRLLPALEILKQASHSRRALAALAIRGWRGAGGPTENEALARMSLDRPRGLRERFSRALLRGALRESPAEG